MRTRALLFAIAMTSGTAFADGEVVGAFRIVKTTSGKHLPDGRVIADACGFEQDVVVISASSPGGDASATLVVPCVRDESGALVAGAPSIRLRGAPPAPAILPAATPATATVSTPLSPTAPVASPIAPPASVSSAPTAAALAPAPASDEQPVTAELGRAAAPPGGWDGGRDRRLPLWIGTGAVGVGFVASLVVFVVTSPPGFDFQQGACTTDSTGVAVCDSLAAHPVPFAAAGVALALGIAAIPLGVQLATEPTLPGPSASSGAVFGMIPSIDDERAVAAAWR